MTRTELAKYYFMACSNAHEELDLLYEKLHADAGMPIVDADKVNSLIQATNQRMRLELEIAKSALQEYNEETTK